MKKETIKSKSQLVLPEKRRQDSSAIKMIIAYYITAFFVILVLGCNHSKRQKNYLAQIQGDWISETFKSEWGNKILIYSFEDSLCSYLYPFGPFTNFEIQEDTLFVKEKVRKKRRGTTGGKEIFSYLIENITDGKLTLIPLSRATKSLFKYYENQDFDTLKLKKINFKTEIKFERAGFYSSGCFGICPEMYLEVDSVGNFLFWGKRYTDVEGFFKGKLTNSDLRLVKQKINSIELDSLNEYYYADWTDDQTCGVKIKSTDKIYKSSAYGFDKEPVELRILFYKLMELYRHVDLVQDSTVKERFQFKELMFGGLPPPPLFQGNKNQSKKQ